MKRGASVDLEVAGLQHTSEMLQEAAARGYDMRPAMRKIRDLLIEGHKEQFATQGGFLGTPWPPNAPGTLANKARLGQGSTPMVASGATKESLAGGKGRRTRVSKGSVSVGTSIWWTIFAMAGASGGRKGTEPARPPIGINEAETEAALTLMEEHLLGHFV